MKTLKLIKNKLTDDCLEELLASLAQTNVNSLNLSQNLLTDKALGILSQNLNNNKNLKNVTLNLNKINRRAVKNKID